MDEKFIRELQTTLRGPLLSKKAREEIQQTIEAAYACGSRTMAAALAYLLNTEDRHRKAMARIEDVLNTSTTTGE